MSASVQEISNTIRDLVAAAGQVPGSRLSAALKERASGWAPADFGVRSLREFVAVHVPGVRVVGRSGMDVLYGLAGSEPTPSPSLNVDQTLYSEPDFWRIWVSPNSPFALVVNRSGDEITAVRRGDSSAPAGHVFLDPPGIDVHRSVASDFLETTEDDLKTRLAAALEKSTDGWWQAWLRELRGSAHLGNWNMFRRSAFEDRLRERLRAAELGNREIEHVITAIRDRHLAVALRRRRTSPAVQAVGDVDVLRRVVIDAVQRMSNTELRDLRLPIGIVLDVLASSKPSG